MFILIIITKSHNNFSFVKQKAHTLLNRLIVTFFCPSVLKQFIYACKLNFLE